MKKLMTREEFIKKIEEQYKSCDELKGNILYYQMGKNIMVDGIKAILRSNTVDFGNEIKKEYLCVSTRYEPEVTNKSLIKVFCFPNECYQLTDWGFNESQTGVWGEFNKRRTFIPFCNVKQVRVIRQNDD